MERFVMWCKYIDSMVIDKLYIYHSLRYKLYCVSIIMFILAMIGLYDVFVTATH